MVPNPYTREKLALEHRQTLLCEAEHERLLADVQPLFLIRGNVLQEDLAGTWSSLVPDSNGLSRAVGRLSIASSPVHERTSVRCTAHCSFLARINRNQQDLV